MASESPKRSYSKTAQKKISRVMREYHRGKLHSGTGKKGQKGGKVKSREQAAAIAISKARRRGYKVPAKKK